MPQNKIVFIMIWQHLVSNLIIFPIAVKLFSLSFEETAQIPSLW